MNEYQYIGVIELDNGLYFHVEKVTTPDGVYLEAGTVTNTGFIPLHGIDLEDGDDLDCKLQDLYDLVVSREAELDELYN